MRPSLHPFLLFITDLKIYDTTISSLAASATPQGQLKRAASPCPSAKPSGHAAQGVVQGVRNHDVAGRVHRHARRLVEARSWPVHKGLVIVVAPSDVEQPPRGRQQLQHVLVGADQSTTTYTSAHAHACSTQIHTESHANASPSLCLPDPHPFPLLLPDQDVEGRAQGRVRSRCSC
jgi:hypothetical protein